ncbi:hypothetical protein [Sphaerisporangium dianthi]|uniref:Uncharacterized protein n=1 Tax=Sphaerisporangium dianthi TaxID=1436120 RepID=A0ABV9CB22_9ACTN
MRAHNGHKNGGKTAKAQQSPLPAIKASTSTASLLELELSLPPEHGLSVPGSALPGLRPEIALPALQPDAAQGSSQPERRLPAAPRRIPVPPAPVRRVTPPRRQPKGR